jgi:hypothetical protein
LRICGSIHVLCLSYLGMQSNFNIDWRVWHQLWSWYIWVQSQSNKLKRPLDCREKQSKFDKYLSFAIKSHGNHGKLLLFHSYECYGIQIKNSFDKILSFKFWFKTSKSEYKRVGHVSILQRIIKHIHIINHMGKKI